MLWVWEKLISFSSKCLVIGGLALIGYGIFHWWMGYPYPLVLFVYWALGFLALGPGLALRQPATTARLALSSVSFALSGILFIWMYWEPPWQQEILAVIFFCGAGAMHSYIRLRRRRGPGKNVR